MLNFDGTNDIVTAGPSSAFSYGSAFTVEAWVLPRSGSAYQWIAAHKGSPLYAGWVLDLGTNSNVRFQFNNSMSSMAQAPVALDAWHHVAGVYDNGAIRLFVDGVLAASGSASMSAATTDKLLGIGGAADYLSDYPWAGSMGPIRISRSVRYAAAFTPVWGWSSDANTIALWNLYEGSGATIGDSSSNGNAGSINGPTWSTISCPALSSSSSPTWRAMGTKSATVMMGSCGNTQSATVACTAANIGTEVRVNSASTTELKPTTTDTGFLQGQSASVSGSNITITGRTGCTADNLQTVSVTYYVCGY